jgi:hypothetical protein
MTTDNQNVQASVTDDGTQTASATDTSTQPEQSESVEQTSQNNAGYVDNSNVVNNEETVNYKEKFEQLSPKVSKLESENNALKRQVPRTISSQEANSINSRVTNLLKTDPSEARRVFDEFKSSGNLTDTTGKSITNSNLEDFYQVPQQTVNTQPARSSADIERETNLIVDQKLALRGFYGKHPEMDINNTKEADRRDVAIDNAHLMQMAKDNMAYYNMRGTQMSLDVALETAYKQMKPDSTFENGVLVGKQQAYAQGMNQTQVVSNGASSGNTQNVSLTQEEIEMAKLYGNDPKAMLEQKKSGLL